MPPITIDTTLTAKLRGLAHPVELCDESGRILGRYVPVANCEDRTQPQISDEEMSRRKQETGGRPLADILRDLENRA